MVSGSLRNSIVIFTYVSLADNFENVWLRLASPSGSYRGGGGGNCHVWAIWVCATVKGMVFKEFTLAYGI